MIAAADRIQPATDSRDGADRLFEGRIVTHVTPLHYLPSILALGSLISASAGRKFGIQPRKSAARRDRMLSVDEFVHLSFEPLSPLLLDKLRLGMPHVALEFDAQQVFSERREDCALLPFNTKAWRSRSSAQPSREPSEMAEMLRRHDEFGRYPSMEFLVERKLELTRLRSIVVFNARDEALIKPLIEMFAPSKLNTLALRSFGGYAIVPIPRTVEYFNACLTHKVASAPPAIEFD